MNCTKEYFSRFTRNGNDGVMAQMKDVPKEKIVVLYICVFILFLSTYTCQLYLSLLSFCQVFFPVVFLLVSSLIEFLL